MIADKQKNGIGKVFFLRRRGYKGPVTKIGITECNHFLITPKPILAKRIKRHRHRMKSLPVLSRNSIGTMVVRRLYHCKKRPLLLRQRLIGLQKEVFVADTPHIHLRSAII